MYERTSMPVHIALAQTQNSKKEPVHRQSSMLGSLPGQFIGETLGKTVASAISYDLHNNPEENTISRYAEYMGLKYNTVSELNSTGSALCGLFYEPGSTFIILSFKGTSAADFSGLSASQVIYTRHTLTYFGWIRMDDRYDI